MMNKVDSIALKNKAVLQWDFNLKVVKYNKENNLPMLYTKAGTKSL